MTACQDRGEHGGPDSSSFPLPPEVALDLLWGRPTRRPGQVGKLVNVTPVTAPDQDSGVHAAPQACGAALVLPVQIATLVVQLVPLQCAHSLRLVSHTWVSAVDSIADEHWLCERCGSNAARRAKQSEYSRALRELFGATPTAREMVELYVGMKMPRYTGMQGQGTGGHSDAALADRLFTELNALNYADCTLVTPPFLPAAIETYSQVAAGCMEAFEAYRQSATAAAWRRTSGLTLALLV